MQLYGETGCYFDKAGLNNALPSEENSKPVLKIDKKNAAANL